MKTLKFLPLFVVKAVLALSFLPLHAQSVPSELNLRVDEQKTLSFPESVRSATASDPSVLELQGIGERELLIRAKKAGKASIQYTLRSDVSGVIEVSVGRASGLEPIQQFLVEELRDVVGVEVRVKEDLGLVQVSGSIRRHNDWQRVSKVLAQAEKLWAGKVLNSTHFMLDRAIVEESLIELLKAFEVAQPAAEVGEGSVVLRGVAVSEARRLEVEPAVRTMLERFEMKSIPLQNAIVVSDAVIEVEMIFFQLSEDSVDEVGIDLLNNIGLDVKGAAIWGSGEPKYTAVLDIQLGKVFNMLAEDGVIQSINPTTVTTANGVEASSQFGETLVIVKRGADRDTVEQIDVGHILKVTPTLRGNGSVRLQLAGEVSEVGPMTSGGDYRLNKQQFSNTMDLPLGSGMVAAFHKSERKVTVDGGTPILRKIPIVNLVFGRKKEQTQTSYRGFLIVPRTKGVVAAVPASVSDKTDEIIRRVRERIAAEKN